MSLESDMTLLYLAARVDPTLRAACTRVDEELRALRESRDALVEALRKWKCFYCRGRGIEPCMCDGQSCDSSCHKGDLCHVCDGSGLDKASRAAIERAEATNGDR